MGNKKSVNKILLNELVDVDMKDIDMDTFGESLLWLVPSIEGLVDMIENQVIKMANIRYMPYVTAEEQCEYVINSICVKNDLVNVYNVFKYWHERLNNEHKQLYDAYFVWKNVSVYKRKSRTITPLIRTFVRYLNIMFDAKATELIKNPYIYDIYIDTLAYNQSMKNRGFATRNKGVRHDCTANAKRNS